LSEAELARLRQQIRELLTRLHWTDQDLDAALTFNPAGRYTRKVLSGLQHPSQTYRDRLAELLAAEARGEVQPKPAWAPALVYDPAAAAVPLRQVAAAARQCVECLAEHAEGRRRERDTWWWFGHPRTRVCPEHQAAHRRRRAWFARCLARGCTHAVPVPTGGLTPAYTCAQAECPYRRQVWRKGCATGLQQKDVL
jgi:hypothetical protein